MRIRGEFLAFLSLATDALDGFSGAVGIGIATVTAITAGVASVPTPITEAESDNWLWHRFFALKAGGPFITTADPGGNLSTQLRIEIDSKAMRKNPLELALYAAVEVVEVGTATVSFHLDSRVLDKLS